MFTEIRNKKNKLCQVVKVSEVEQCSINALMYKNTEERNAYLLSSMRKHYEETGIPNKEPIEVDVDGIVLSGNTRLTCAIEIGCEYLLAYESDVRCSEMNDYEIAKYLEMRNNDGKRDESDPRVIYQLIKALELLFEKNNGGSFAHSDDRKEFIKEHGLQVPDLNKIIKIGDKDKSLLDEVHSGETTLAKAYKKALGIVNPNVIADPDRFNFFKHYDENPKLREEIVFGIKQSVDHFNKTPIDGRSLIHHDDFGFEKNQITSVYSNIINVTTAAVYTRHGIDAVTGRKKRDDSESRPDISFPGLTKDIDEFQKEKIEVKAASWNHNTTPGTCMFYGGPGAKNCTPHEYLIGIWKKNCEKLFLMLTTLTPDDWISAGKREFNMSILKWYNNHFHRPEEYRILMGDIYMSDGKVEVEYDNVTTNSVERFAV